MKGQWYGLEVGFCESGEILWNYCGEVITLRIGACDRNIKGLCASVVAIADQFRFLGNCPPTPPLSQHLHLLFIWGKMLSKGRGRWAVSQKPKLIRNCYLRAKRTTIKIHQNFFLFYSFCALRLLGLVCVQTTPPLKKIGERLLPEYFLGEGPSVHRLGLVLPSSVASNRTEMAKNTT